MRRILRLAILIGSITAFGGVAIWCAQPRLTRPESSNEQVAQTWSGATVGGVISRISRVVRATSLAERHAQLVVATKDVSPADTLEQLTEEQRGRVQPALEVLAQMEEAALNDGDDELMAKVRLEKQRLLRAVAGLDR